MVLYSTKRTVNINWLINSTAVQTSIDEVTTKQKIDRLLLLWQTTSQQILHQQSNVEVQNIQQLAKSKHLQKGL